MTCKHPLCSTCLCRGAQRGAEDQWLCCPFRPLLCCQCIRLARVLASTTHRVAHFSGCLQPGCCSRGWQPTRASSGNGLSGWQLDCQGPGVYLQCMRMVCSNQQGWEAGGQFACSPQPLVPQASPKSASAALQRACGSPGDTFRAQDAATWADTQYTHAPTLLRQPGAGPTPQ